MTDGPGLTKARCERCEDQGWYWTTPVGFNPFRAGGRSTARAMYRQPCSCAAASTRLVETLEEGGDIIPWLVSAAVIGLNAARAEPPVREEARELTAEEQQMFERSLSRSTKVIEVLEPPVREEAEAVARLCETASIELSPGTPLNVVRQVQYARDKLRALSHPSPPLDGPSRASLQNMQTTPSRESKADKIARLQREIGERTMQLQRLVLGDPTQTVMGQSTGENGHG